MHPLRKTLSDFPTLIICQLNSKTVFPKLIFLLHQIMKTSQTTFIGIFVFFYRITIYHGGTSLSRQNNFLNQPSPFIQDNAVLIRMVSTSRHWRERTSRAPRPSPSAQQDSEGPHCYEMKYIDGVTAVWRNRMEKILFLLVNPRLTSWSGLWL